MERTKNSLSRTSVAIIVIILFHAVGLIGFFIPAARPLFLQIVPFHLLLMLLVLLYSYGKPDARVVGFALLSYLLGFISEWIGVHRHLIFGDYAYGATLGFKLDEIPVTMGINWFLLIYATGVLMQRLPVNSLALRVLLGAALLVVLDVLIEPVAQRFDYWHWANGMVPLSNYMGWFGVSIASLLLFEAFRFKQQSWAGPVLLAVQFLFFALLQLA